MTRQLYDHQHAAIELLRTSLRAGHTRPMLMAPTGFGKTLTAAVIIRNALNKGKKVAFTVPSISLIDQTVEEFGAEGITEIGVIQADHPLTDSSKSVQVCSVQSLVKRQFPWVDLVLNDEAHEMHKVIFKWMAERQSIPFIGLSATPWSKGLGKFYDDLLIAATTKDLIERGYLSKFRVFAPSHPDLKGVHTVGGDYHEGELAAAMDKPQLVADVVSTWMRLGENRPTFCFAVNRAHARSLELEFQRANITTGYIDALTEREDRNRIGRAFNAGRIKVVVNVGVLTRGIDWDVRCLILARPTKSEKLFVQIVGRALRNAEGKDDALILDHSDTTLKLGFVTDIHHEHLDTGKPDEGTSARAQKKPKLPTECPAAGCNYVKPAGVRKCPACGFEPVHRKAVDTIDGDLVQLAGKARSYTQVEKQRFWSGLLWYVENRGKSEGWASHKFKDRFGVWPRGLSSRSMEPDIACRNYVKASAIRFRKEMEKRERANAA